MSIPISYFIDFLVFVYLISFLYLLQGKLHNGYTNCGILLELLGLPGVCDFRRICWFKGFADSSFLLGLVYSKTCVCTCLT